MTKQQKFNDASKEVGNHRVCPECSHVFRGNGWDGIDAHWKAKHEHIMPYKDAWTLIKAETYKSAR